MKKQSLTPWHGLFLACTILCMAAGTGASLAQSALRDLGDEITTEVEGEAEIQGQDLSGARKRAMDHALKKAFENALAEVLPGELSLAEIERLHLEMAAGMERYLLRYRVLSEMPALHVFFVTVEATFSVPLMIEELKTRGAFPADETPVEMVEIDLRLTGVVSPQWYQDLMGALQDEMPLVQDAGLREVCGSDMVLRVRSGQDAQALAHALSLWHFESFEFRVAEVTDREISASLASIDSLGQGFVSPAPDEGPLVVPSP